MKSLRLNQSGKKRVAVCGFNATLKEVDSIVAMIADRCGLAIVHPTEFDGRRDVVCSTDHDMPSAKMHALGMDARDIDYVVAVVAPDAFHAPAFRDFIAVCKPDFVASACKPPDKVLWRNLLDSLCGGKVMRETVI